MKCNKCGSEQLVVSNTRNLDWGIKRIRVCMDCGNHMPTIEINKVTDEAIKSLDKTKRMSNKRQGRKLNEHENV